MNNVIIASDSFKGSATSAEIADYLEDGILSADPAIIIKKVPIADGGEGTVYCVIRATRGRFITNEVSGPLGNKIKATWGLIDKKTAIIETAEAAGMTLINDQLDIDHASTYGVGQLILSALNHDVKTIYVGLGGSATNDGGIGMAQALGAHFYSQDGHELHRGTYDLDKLARIDLSTLDNRIFSTKIIGLSDVNNPLIGKNGASQIFGPQKGANRLQIKLLDRALRKLARTVKGQLGLDFAESYGAGAAGGLGYGLLTFCRGKICSGIQEVIKLVKLDQKMADATLVITGEGQIDGQSLGGKVPIGVAKLAKQHNLPVIAIVGSVGTRSEEVYTHGIDLILSTTNKPMSINEAIKQTPELVKQAGFTVIKAIKLGQSIRNVITTQDAK